MSYTVKEDTVSESLRIILVKKNLNIARLAELLGVSSTTMYSKFKRNNFTLKDLEEISRVLDLTCDIVFTIND